MSTCSTTPLCRLIAGRLWTVRPRRSIHIHGRHNVDDVEVSLAGTSVVLSLSSESALHHDVQRVLSALCAAIAGLGRSDREVRTVDLEDVADHSEQVAVIDRLAETLPGPRGGSHDLGEAP